MLLCIQKQQQNELLESIKNTDFINCRIPDFIFLNVLCLGSKNIPGRSNLSFPDATYVACG